MFGCGKKTRDEEPVLEIIVSIVGRHFALNGFWLQFKIEFWEHHYQRAIPLKCIFVPIFSCLRLNHWITESALRMSFEKSHQ